MRISILSNVNLDMVLHDLRKKNEIFSLPGYNQWISVCLNPEQMCSFEPQIIYLIIDGNALLEDYETQEDKTKYIDSCFEYISQLAVNFSQTNIFVSTIDVWPEIRTGKSQNKSSYIMGYWNKCIEQIIKQRKNILCFDLENIIANYGRKKFYSKKLWYSGLIPYDIGAIKILVQHIEKINSNILNTRKKLLILDLDNTLWGGILGENGINDINLGTSKMGLLYRDCQKKILQIKNTGVLLAIASKNNMQDVKNVFEQNRNMVLKWSDFVSIKVNWKPKSINISEMAQELNLGLESFVFLDDNVLEREEILSQLPEVNVVDFPTDITKLPETINHIFYDYFWCKSITNEDRNKTQEYHARELRNEERKNVFSFEEYLKSLEIKIELDCLRENSLERVLQLINKTNQFNTMSIRMESSTLFEYLNNPSKIVISAKVSDKFGDEGIVAVVILHKADETNLIIENFLMSCRVMGRKIEYSIIQKILNSFYDNGIRKVYSKYRETKKNEAIKNIWESMNFKFYQENDGIRIYEKEIKKIQKDIHQIYWRK
ncbi:MAG: HAD-IIIC family phosphatase [Lachnospiraceae bacterium]